MYFIIFTCLTELTRSSNAMLDGSGDNGIPFVVSGLTVKHSVIHREVCN